MQIYIKLVLTTIFWGGNFIVGKIITTHIEPFSIAFWRFALASVFYLLLIWKTEGKLLPITRKQIMLIVLFGMTGMFMANAFFFKGLKLIEASRASVIVAINPIVIALLSACFLKEKLSIPKVIGIVLSVCGAMLVITKGNLLGVLNGNIGWGELYILLNALSWAASTLIGRIVMRELPPLISVSYAAVAGTVGLFLLAYSGEAMHAVRYYSPLEWVGLVYLGFFGTGLTFFWYFEGIKSIGPIRASLFINFVPISSLVLAFLTLGEPITSSLAIGTLCVISGVYLTNTKTVACTK